MVSRTSSGKDQERNPLVSCLRIVKYNRASL